jgi:alcohol dehydrogenase
MNDSARRVGACARSSPRPVAGSPGGRSRPRRLRAHTRRWSTPLPVATCDLDRPLALGATPFPLPLRFGHECVAEVLSVGDQVARLRPGQRVVVPFQISCGSCSPCQAGHTGNCASVPPISMYGFGVAGGHWGGALSDQLAVPYADAMLVPDHAQR